MLDKNLRWGFQQQICNFLKTPGATWQSALYEAPTFETNCVNRLLNYDALAKSVRDLKKVLFLLRLAYLHHLQGGIRIFALEVLFARHLNLVESRITYKVTLRLTKQTKVCVTNLSKLSSAANGTSKRIPNNIESDAAV